MEPDAEFGNRQLDDAHIKRQLLEDEVRLLTDLQRRGSPIDDLSVDRLPGGNCVEFQWLLQHIHCLKKLDLLQDDIPEYGPQTQVTVPLLKGILSTWSPQLETVRHRMSHFKHYILETDCFKTAQYLRSLDVEYTGDVWDLDLSYTEHFADFLGRLPMNLTYLALEPGKREFNSLLNVFLDSAPKLRTLLPSLETLVLLDRPAAQGAYFSQLPLARLQTAYADVGIVLQSMPRIGDHYDLVNIEHIEPGWVWVQPIEISSGEWTAADFFSTFRPGSTTYFEDWTVVSNIQSQRHSSHW
ncbi:hypothetical protein NX059_000318 [Plenodomus lindquistii]|nr:hypothetical protein NX059_000318 [Plenodomus lindquistii]